MELMGAIIGLNRLWWRADKFESAKIRKRKVLVVYSDSAYLVNCFLQGWIPNWRRRDWRKADGKPVANREFWETLENLVEQYKEVRFVHVKGHNGTANNELADQQAVLARESMRGRAMNAKLKGLPKPKPVDRPYPYPHGVNDTVSRSRSRASSKKRRGKAS